jgi:hypothetical protein
MNNYKFIKAFLIFYSLSLSLLYIKRNYVKAWLLVIIGLSGFNQGGFYGHI